ncbi:MAG TPA: putative metal-binding motif-containing protein, partial [Polyangiaceae bacterium]|nr:putative metal-binding motif-containing protein [Polyangiaceae bacterium]
MIVRFSGRSGRALGPAAVLAAVVALGACSGGGGSGGTGSAFDGGVVTDGSPGVDSSVGHDSGSGSGSSSGSSSGGGFDAAAGPDSSSGAGDTGAGDDGGGDASFGFDGFSHPDGYSEASYCPDDDGDGWTVCGGDCNDHDSLVNPCAFDTNDPTDPVGTDGIDNDCDGQVDNLIACETGLVAGHDQTPADYAHASDLCDNPMCPRLTNSLWYGTNLANAKRVTGHMGTPPQFSPHQGAFMSFLSTGNAEDNTDAPSYLTCPGTILNASAYANGNPLPLTAAQNVNLCGQGKDESTVPVYDYTELRMTVTAPINAGSYTFDFAFF